jgi:threonine dehydrogenase-like Zn-dependent dehydrogenase
MRGTVLYGKEDIRFEDVPEPKINQPTDAIIRMSATCVVVPISGVIAALVR